MIVDDGRPLHTASEQIFGEQLAFDLVARER